MAIRTRCRCQVGPAGQLTGHQGTIRIEPQTREDRYVESDLIAARAKVSHQIGRCLAGRQGVEHEGVVARTTSQRIAPQTAKEQIVTGRPVQTVAARITDQHIVVVRALQILDADQCIGTTPAIRRRSRCLAVGNAPGTGDGCRGQIDRHTEAIEIAVQIIEVGHDIRAGTAIHRVVTGAALEVVVLGTAGDRIGEGRAIHRFDIEQGVCPAHAVIGRTIDEIDRHPGGGGGVEDPIEAAATIDEVAALATAEAFEEIIGDIAAVEGIVEVGAGDIVDADQGDAVARPVAGIAVGELDEDGGTGSIELDGINLEGAA